MTAQQHALVLFDLDGTLIDSAPDLAGAANAMRVARGLEALPVAALRPMVGRTIDPADTALLLRTLASALVEIEDYAGAITTLDRTVAKDDVVGFGAGEVLHRGAPAFAGHEPQVRLVAAR